MAELVGIWACSHTPVMLNFPEAAAEEERRAVFAAFEDMGTRIAATRPETVIVISDDHVHNFFFDNFPAFCIGAATHYDTPVEHWLKAPRQRLRGDADLGAHLLGQAFENGFDPSFSIDLTLDHGALTPLMLAGLAPAVTVVPLLVNCVQTPMPTMRRCVDWGQMLRGAVASYAGCERVAILATGGLSHDIATPRMGLLNEDFDRGFLERLADGDTDSLVAFARDQVHTAGNGAEEVRTWLIAHGAAQGVPCRPLLYVPVRRWYTGIGLVEWTAGAT